MSCIIKEDMGLGCIQDTLDNCSQSHWGNNRSKNRKLCLTSTRRMLRQILFTKEKIIFGESYSKQNDRVYARTSKGSELIPRIERGNHPINVMVNQGVSIRVLPTFVFMRKESKFRRIYQTTI